MFRFLLFMNGLAINCRVLRKKIMLFAVSTYKGDRMIVNNFSTLECRERAVDATIFNEVI